MRWEIFPGLYTVYTEHPTTDVTPSFSLSPYHTYLQVDILNARVHVESGSTIYPSTYYLSSRVCVESWTDTAIIES